MKYRKYGYNRLLAGDLYDWEVIETGDWRSKNFGVLKEDLEA